MSRPSLSFWYDLASQYSWLAARRIEAMAEAAGVAVTWRPFLVGPVFAAQGWHTSPFNIYAAKGAYAWRDVEREAQRLGLGLVRPDPFPQNSLFAARVALAVEPEGALPAYTVALYAEEFERGRSISAPEVIGPILARLGLDENAILAKAASEPVKTRLKAIGDEVKALGIFGAPTFVTQGGEMFWGNDRLQRALAWAKDEAAGHAA